MGFSCINKNGELIVSPETIQDTNLLRSLGLSNVNNINTDVTFCTEVFEGPQYYVTGTTILVTGLTQTLTGCTTGTTAIYNLTYTPEFDISFILTGGTEYTGYTGNFCYKIFSDNQFSVDGPIRGLINGTEFINNCFAFSAITSTTLTQEFLEGSLSRTWGQYMIRPYYTFASKECSPGLYFDTWNSTTQLNLISDADYYFMTVINPPTPLLPGLNGGGVPNNTFIQDILLFNGIAVPMGPSAINRTLNNFILKTIPAYPDIFIYVNGVKMAQGYDYTVLYRNLLTPPEVVFNMEIKTTDWIVANYFTGIPSPTINYNNTGWFVDTFIVDSILVDANVGYVNEVNSNTISGNLEIYTTRAINPNNAIYVSVNGVEMVQDREFYLSTTKDNRLIWDKTYANPIIIGDVISIFTLSSNITNGIQNYGSLPQNSFTINWSVPSELPNNVTGKFLIQFFEVDDVTNTVLFQQETPFINGQSNYEATTILQSGKYYRFKITYITEYTAYLNNIITTCSFSEGLVDTDNQYNIQTY